MYRIRAGRVSDPKVFNGRYSEIVDYRRASFTGMIETE